MAAPRPKAPAVRPRSTAVGPGSDEDFVFESSLGEITVPSLSKAPKPNSFSITRAMAIKSEPVRNATMTLLFLEAALGDRFEELAELFEKLPGDEFDTFGAAWQEHSGVTSGE